MTCQINSIAFWDSTPIGRSIDLCLCPYEQLSPQLILEDKVFRSAIRLQNEFIGTLISDDESQRLTYVIDRHSIPNDTNHHQPLTGEFLVVVQYDNKYSTVQNNSIQNAMKEIDLYCRSSEPIELHRFLYLSARISSLHSSSIDLSFDLLTINNSFTLTPITPNYIQIVPTALLKNLSSPTGNNTYNNAPHFGYCSLDRMSNNRILLLLENDPQVCALPLIGIWISGIVDIQCAFVWTVCLRYCLNSSLKQRLRSGINPQQSFLFACFSPTSHGQCIFYEIYSKSSSTIDYDLWTCSKQISLSNSTTLFPYDFQFKRVYNQSNDDPPVEIHSEIGISTILSSPNTNGSLFGIPRIPPKQSAHQSPTWNSTVTSPITTPNRSSRPPPPPRSPKLRQFSSPTSTPVATTDDRWKLEFIERMKAYESQIQSLTALVTELLTAQQNPLSPSTREYTKRDVGIQTPPSSPYINDRSSSIAKSQPQTSVLHTNDGSMMSPVIHQEETMIDYSSLRKSSSIPTDVNPVDILKPIFRFIDNQQHKHQHQQGSAPSSITTDTELLKTNDEEPDCQTENMFELGNTIQQQQHVTSTTTTGISFISNGVQMQFINQQSSTTTVYPQSQPTSPPPPPPPPPPSLPTSPPRSENSLSIEVHGLEMKYLEDDQLAAAIECDRQSQTPPVADKSLSFGTQEYLERYGLFTDSNSS